MRLIKLALISFVLLFALGTLLSLLLPSSITISRAIDIKATAANVYPQVNDLANWKYWVDNYDSITNKVSKISAGAGATLLADNKKIEIITSNPNTINANWQVSNGPVLPGEFNFIQADSANTMTLQWQFTHKVQWYPWEKFGLLVSDQALGPFMQKSLENLKGRMEEISK